MIGIYCIRCIIDDRRYIGQSVDIYNRFKEHKHPEDSFHQSSIYLQNSINKHGIDNFEFTVLEECSRDELDEREKYWIKFYDTYVGFKDCKGYNLTIGGGGISGFKHSEDTKRKLSEAHMGKKHSEETRLKMSLSRKGKHRSEESLRKQSLSLKGRVFTQEHLKSLSESHKGVKLSDSHRSMISSSMKGREFSEEHRRNLSEAAKGRILSEDQRSKISKTLQGYKHSEESKLKMSKTRQGYVCVNNGIINKYTYSEDELNHYLSEGWVRGKIKRKDN